MRSRPTNLFVDTSLAEAQHFLDSIIETYMETQPFFCKEAFVRREQGKLQIAFKCETGYILSIDYETYKNDKQKLEHLLFDINNKNFALRFN